VAWVIKRIDSRKWIEFSTSRNIIPPAFRRRGIFICYFIDRGNGRTKKKSGGDEWDWIALITGKNEE